MKKSGVYLATQALLLLIIFSCICLFVSCQNKSVKATLQSFKEKSIGFKKKRLELDSFQKSLINTVQIQYTKMANSIDTSKVRVYEKDDKIKSELKSIKARIDKNTRQFENYLKDLEQSNNNTSSYIELYKWTSKNETELQTELEQISSLSENTIDKMESLLLELNELSMRNAKLIEYVIKKYGKPAK